MFYVQLGIMLSVLFTGIVVIGISTNYTSKQIVNPIVNLTKMMEFISKGDVSREIPYNDKKGLDEITYLMSFALLPEQEILDFLLKRPCDIHIVITGRKAPVSFMEKADIVTEMREIKHLFHDGIKAQKGIEW